MGLIGFGGIVMQYKQFEKEIKESFRSVLKRGSYKLVFKNDSDVRKTVMSFEKKRVPIVYFGVNSVYHSGNVLFADYVHGLIDSFHEAKHVFQYDMLFKEKVPCCETISLISTYGSPDYYIGSYDEDISEIDAQIFALEKSKEYLHGLYPNNTKEINEHILYWGKLWFINLPEKLNCNDLDIFITGMKEYKMELSVEQSAFKYEKPSDDLIYKRVCKNIDGNRIRRLDFIFLNSENGFEQRCAAAEMVLEEKPYIKKCIKSLGCYQFQENQRRVLPENISFMRELDNEFE